MKNKTRRRLHELRGPAYLDKPDGTTRLHWVCSQDVQVVPALGVRGIVKPFPLDEVKGSLTP